MLVMLLPSFPKCPPPLFFSTLQQLPELENSLGCLFCPEHHGFEAVSGSRNPSYLLYFVVINNNYQLESIVYTKNFNLILNFLLLWTKFIFLSSLSCCKAKFQSL